MDNREGEFCVRGLFYLARYIIWGFAGLAVIYILFCHIFLFYKLSGDVYPGNEIAPHQP